MRLLVGGNLTRLHREWDTAERAGEAVETNIIYMSRVYSAEALHVKKRGRILIYNGQMQPF